MPKIKTYMGVDIDFDASTGKFSAEIGGKHRTSSNLKTLESEIRKADSGVQVIVLTSHSRMPSEPSVQRVLDVDRLSLKLNAKDRIWGDAFVYDEAILHVLSETYQRYLKELANLQENWESEWQSLKRQIGLKPVNPEAIAEQLRKQRSTDESSEK